MPYKLWGNEHFAMVEWIYMANSNHCSSVTMFAHDSFRTCCPRGYIAFKLTLLLTATNSTAHNYYFFKI